MTGILELIAVQNIVNGGVMTAIWRSNKRAQEQDMLMGRRGPKRMPLVEKMVSRWLVSKKATEGDRRMASRYAGWIRSLANTRAFELLLLAGMTNHGKFDRWFKKSQRFAGKMPGMKRLPGVK